MRFSEPTLRVFLGRRFDPSMAKAIVGIGIAEEHRRDGRVLDTGCYARHRCQIHDIGRLPAIADRRHPQMPATVVNPSP
jgi:hypothetical protein